MPALVPRHAHRHVYYAPSYTYASSFADTTRSTVDNNRRLVKFTVVVIFLFWKSDFKTESFEFSVLIGIITVITE